MLPEFQETFREISAKVFFSGRKSFSSDFLKSLGLKFPYDVSKYLLYRNLFMIFNGYVAKTIFFVLSKKCKKVLNSRLKEVFFLLITFIREKQQS